jgi:hypothetical protein
VARGRPIGLDRGSPVRLVTSIPYPNRVALLVLGIARALPSYLSDALQAPALVLQRYPESSVGILRAERAFDLQPGHPTTECPAVTHAISPAFLPSVRGLVLRSAVLPCMMPLLYASELNSGSSLLVLTRFG